MLVVVDEREQQLTDAVSPEQHRLTGRSLPAGRIVFVPFSLVEVEQQAEDERR